MEDLIRTATEVWKEGNWSCEEYKNWTQRGKWKSDL